MRKLPTYRPLILATLAAVLGISPMADHAADLTVEVRNVKPRRGEVRAALFDDARSFTAGTRIRAMVKDGEITSGVFTREQDFPREPAATTALPAQGRTLILRFTDLDPGEYAIGVYQDLNGDERLDITLGGLSLEPWGISNDAGSLDADPRWEDARFELPPEGRSLVVHLRDERRDRQGEDPR